LSFHYRTGLSHRVNNADAGCVIIRDHNVRGAQSDDALRAALEFGFRLVLAAFVDAVD
jgi:hypothetical protein